MGWWQVGADTLAGSRFVLSPLAEAIASLKVLERGTAAHPGERVWLDAHLPAYQRRKADDPVTALLLRAALRPTWNATFLTPTPTSTPTPAGEGKGGRTFEDELARIRQTPPETARADLAEALRGPLPAPLHRPDLPALAAGLVEWVWTRTVLPDWSRRRRIIEADVVARTRQLSRHGWAGALDDMRAGMRWLGHSRLQITACEQPPREIAGARLMFVPVTPQQSWVSWEADRYAVVYPCSGVLTDSRGTPAPEPLSALLGPSRASVFVLLGSPKSTTQLVALTGRGLGSVGRHLKVLLDAHLIQRRRSGRSVLYYWTAAGEALAEAQSDG
ncbi:transcriptional regulator [Streptomyces agglomeratus]|uniref:Transcriptional regulator n=1 Tax=Streptomyces agglomeratus TaxID=285458 RepID=A0A1E5P4T9_9ACTN|nr:helix-turn-helix domain-containing protein [Streptomyces agglomeratus]OEJ24553.1 transcriptional regulator [Streptomyces agglomeratus]OEJ41495.1 transcriptional regulator [Streptomyces agglomeratus]OEJ44126.1 transcriptional regulator [Streptomyces agglomeratus]OEJ53985.1 transcriptional regulator [Streptomyces agglomeratus]